MDFYFACLNDIRNNKSDHLYVIIDGKYKNNIKNIVIPDDCIFSFNNEDENTYYNTVANKMKNAGFDGFIDWITRCINDFSNYVYHDEYDKPVIYKSVIFVSDNNTQKLYMQNIFNNFGFSINEYTQKMENYLF